MLELTVFMSGALVMVLEMVGARVLAPHVGTSAVVWTSLIGVVLACLALGAWAGGRLADKTLSRRGLALALAGAGIGSGLTALWHGAIGQWVTAAVGNLYAAAVLAAVSSPWCRKIWSRPYSRPLPKSMKRKPVSKRPFTSANRRRELDNAKPNNGAGAGRPAMAAGNPAQ